MSHRSRCDAFGSFYLDFPRDAAGKPIPKSGDELLLFESAIKHFFERSGYTVRNLKFDVKEGRFLVPDQGLEP